jgi:excisionase family DNA binding protein
MTDQTNQPNEDRLLSYGETAERMGISESTLRRKVREGKIPVIDMGHQIKRFHWPTVLKALNQGKSSE